MRCRTNYPVPVEDILRSVGDWFVPALSIAEATDAIAALVTQGWLAFDEVRQTAQATAAGCSVVACLERPVGYADGWNVFAPIMASEIVPEMASAMGESGSGDGQRRPHQTDKGGKR